MLPYLRVINRILVEGEEREDRTGTGVIGIFSDRMEFDLQKGFPLVTTKKVNFSAIAHELLWFISGNTNIKYLQDNNVKIWNEWADEKGDLGPVYGHQWRHWGRDQLANVIETIKSNPTNRRLIVNTWNNEDLDKMALPPCHMMFQFYVRGEYLDCQMYQRSADMFLGVPYNIASYALLTHLVAHVTGLKPGKFYHVLGDAHLYKNHIEQAKLQLTREPFSLPTLKIRRSTDKIDDIKFEDLELVRYVAHPFIKGEVSV